MKIHDEESNAKFIGIIVRALIPIGVFVAFINFIAVIIRSLFRMNIN